uniref:CSD domain-containing protein n=1 Tax=Panagrellus redivivus TaxID=6233 RepID=A0A7E4V737_PANRE
MSARSNVELLEVDSIDTPPTTRPTRRAAHTDLTTSDEVFKRHLATKPVLKTGITGTVKWYSVPRKFGVITRDDGKSDIFVHLVNITFKFSTLLRGNNGLETDSVAGHESKPVISASFRYVSKVVFAFRFDKDRVRRKSRKTEDAKYLPMSWYQSSKPLSSLNQTDKPKP